MQKKCYAKASSWPVYLGSGVLTKRHHHPCRFIIFKSKPQGRHHVNCFGDIAQNSHSRKQASGQQEPWLLATSLPKLLTLAKKFVKYYKARMQIEESFRDVKSHRFGLGLNYHRTYSAKRLQILLLTATLAFMRLWIIGMATMLAKRHFQFQANTARHKNVLSIIFIDLQMVQETRIKLTSALIADAWRCLFNLQSHHEPG